MDSVVIYIEGDNTVLDIYELASMYYCDVLSIDDEGYATIVGKKKDLDIFVKYWSEFYVYE